MIKPEQIPDEVWSQVALRLESLGCIVPDYTAKLVAAEAINAWPSAAVCHYTIADNEGYEMVLPLPFPQEAGDE